MKFRAWNGKEMIFSDMDSLLNCYKACDFRIESFYSDVFIIMLYTGMKDKNGREIYDGDILEDIGRVYFDNEKGFWTTETGGLYYILKRVSSEIKGNIYEN